MRIEWSLAALLLPMMLCAQENVKVKGRIIDQQGEAVEYVQVGVPKRQIGTISTVDGRFEIDIPCDTLEFFHVSYQPAAYPVTGPEEDVVIVLHEQELPPAVFIGGDTKEKYLLRPGMNVLHRPIYFDVPVSDKPQAFDIQPEETILLEPGRYFIAFQIVGCDSEALQAFLAKPDEERKPWEITMDFPIFLKSSYVREVALGKMEHVPVNIGVAVKGLEYQ